MQFQQHRFSCEEAFFQNIFKEAATLLHVLYDTDSAVISFFKIGSDIQRSCSNAINKMLRRKVAAATSKNANSNPQLTMKDMIESLKVVKPALNNQWRKKYENWANQ